MDSRNKDTQCRPNEKADKAAQRNGKGRTAWDRWTEEILRKFNRKE